MPPPCERLEAALLDDPTDIEQWLVYLDCCAESGLGVGPLVALLSQSRRLDLDPEPGFDLAVALPDPETRCTVRIRLAPGRTGQRRILSARWSRRTPPIDWLVTYGSPA